MSDCSYTGHIPRVDKRKREGLGDIGLEREVEEFFCNRVDKRRDRSGRGRKNLVINPLYGGLSESEGPP